MNLLGLVYDMGGSTLCFGYLSRGTSPEVMSDIYCLGAGSSCTWVCQDSDCKQDSTMPKHEFTEPNVQISFQP